MENLTGMNAVRSLARKYAQETTTHGVAQLAKDGSKLRVFVYAVALLASSAFLLYSFSLTLQSFVKGDTFTNIEIVKKSTQDFPTITLCPNIQYTMSGLLSMFPGVNITRVQRALLFNQDVTDFILTFPNAQSQSFRAFNRLLAPTFENTFFLCSQGEDSGFNCSTRISDLDLQFSACFSINARSAVQKLGRWTSTQVGRVGGFELYLDVVPDDELLSDEKMSGFVFAVHDVDEYPGELTLLRSKYVGPGQTYMYNLALSKEVYKTLPPLLERELCYSE